MMDVQGRSAKIKERSGVDVFGCYQCGKCSAGCPTAKSMNVLPNRLIRMLQLGKTDEALRANSIWQCVSCLACWSRCPKNINLGGLMEALRFIAMNESKTDKYSLKLKAGLPQQGLISALRKFTY